MHKFENFKDLRLNARSETSETTLWPTFTDIMTVILMIFMLTMIVVIIKNANLIDQLLFSQNKEKQIEKILQESQKTVADLRIGLTNLEEKLRAKEMEIILLSDEAKILESNLQSKLAAISTLNAEISELNKKIRILQDTVETKEAEVLEVKEASETEIKRIKEVSEKEIAAINAETKKQIEEFNRKMLVILSQLEEKEAVIITLDSEKKDLELSLAKQRRAYSTLEEKYIKLIRPARSPLGRKVVTVQYSRMDENYRILYKDVGSEQFEKINETALHQRLGALKKALKDKLYVKIIIPEDSGLTYNEAWSFTKNVLSQYDYYYQEKPK
jgi:chromosome segregation ATPase